MSIIRILISAAFNGCYIYYFGEYIIFKIMVLALALSFAAGGCAYFPTEYNAYRAKPYWISHPSGTGYIGGVGYSGVHIKGKFGQRELAVSRAIDDIARQLGVKVDSVVSTYTEGNESSSFSSMNIYSVHTVTGAAFSAKITDVWEDGKSGDLYIYMRIMD